MSAHTCEFCGKPVDPQKDLQKIEGYVRRRSQGGANAIALRKPLQQWAHDGCVAKEQSGLNATQEGMDF